MKKIIFLSAACFLVVSSVFGITRLTFEQHALKPDVPNLMILTEFQDPGLSGSNQIWDFSQLKKKSDFQGEIQFPNKLKSASFSNQFNTELIEFGNSFYFEISEKRIELTGFKSKTGNTVINYDKPFVKMVYPFEYGNSFNGTYSGEILSGSSNGIIDGTYDVEADGYGKLILPNNVAISNALRVKTVKNYTQKFSGNPTEITITTYRWYAQSVRYPLLVLISTEYKSGSRNSVTKQAAYREDVNASTFADANIGNTRFYPNPFNEVLNLSLELETHSKVVVEIYDITGKKMAVLSERSMDAGFYNEYLDMSGLNLKEGMYNLKVTVNDKEVTHNLLHMEH